MFRPRNRSAPSAHDRPVRARRSRLQRAIEDAVADYTAFQFLLSRAAAQGGRRPLFPFGDPRVGAWRPSGGYRAYPRRGRP